MPSLADQQQQFKKEGLSNSDTTARNTTDSTASKNQQPAMGPTTSLGLAGNPFHYAIQQPKEHLFYESFLNSISNDIVRYLAMKNSDARKERTAAPSTPPTPKRRAGARPDGIDRKRSKRNSSRP
ncbi:hypothetical protein DOTSEDRAFT_73145 [Dothistroma septosporum NZE10]|uniref:Uncharacterized protein n=1 Tax=Dothistroma septosporum (strain NZE10 / CBS 128990) TaxID=675120 RepID=N1PLR0_DOTSN|nr:hypothetical protein DOTSEDRAFT_73145 [Dothistroma septosporum NZE10]